MYEGKTSLAGVKSKQDMIDFAKLPLSERAKLATMSVSYGVGAAAITGADHTEPTCYRQDTLDTGLNPPLFPVPEASESSRQQNSRSAVEQRHPADMEQEI